MDKKATSMPDLGRAQSVTWPEKLWIGQRFSRLHSLSSPSLRSSVDILHLQHYKPVPFHIRWINGYNHKANVINLNNEGSTIVFYAAANNAVLYNWSTGQMRILQGHKHMVTNLAADREAKWVVTADSGPENLIIIWDYSDLFPLKTIFSPHKHLPIAKMALSADAKYLLTAAYTSDKTEFFWWIWSENLVEPHAKIEIDLNRERIVGMGFNPYQTDQFLIVTKNCLAVGLAKKIVIIERGVAKITDDYELVMQYPSNKDLNLEYGIFLCYTVVEASAQILLGTNRGAVLLFGYSIEYQEKVNHFEFKDLRFIKALRLEKRKIQVIKSIDNVIVTANGIGEIRFYDEQLKLLYWVHGFQVDSVSNISFNISPRSSQILDPKCRKKCPCWEKVQVESDKATGKLKQKLVLQQLPTDATIGGKPFLVRDFIVCTGKSGVGFVDFVIEKYTTILDNKNSYAETISVHPEKPMLCIGYYDGIVELFNFIEHKLFVRLDLRDRFKTVIPPNEDSIDCEYKVIVPQLSVTCLKYSPSGLHLACGLNTGQLLFLDPSTIEMLTPEPFSDTEHSVTIISFSLDSLTMAFADAGRTVCVYKYDCETLLWSFIGKHRAHYKEITTVLFLPKKNPDGKPKLISLGMDRHMVEYDIGASSNEYLEILSLDRMEQTAIPLSAIVWPTPKDLDPEECQLDVPAILMATDEHKYKIVNYNTTMTLATVLGPRYEHPVRAMQLVTFKQEGEELQYLVFITKDVIGLQKMPLDGNPWKHVGMVAHPYRVQQMCFREDLGIMFTIGHKDTVMMQWTANYRSVEKAATNGGDFLDPYYCLVEDGRPGWLFQEIRDLFYYIQILCQGTFTPAMRRVKDTIPIDSLPDLMRALGFFPSEYEVENIIVEARYRVYLKNPVTEINFDDFVKLYLNHRPACGERIKKLRMAFKNFAQLYKEKFVMARDDFVDMLTANGEHFSRELSWYVLSVLTGHSFEDRATMNEGDFSFLPETITLSNLLSDIIGIPEFDNTSGTYSMKDSDKEGSENTNNSEDSA